MSVLTDSYTLPNGVKIPQVGFGTWQIPNGDKAYQAVTEALRQGYRHIDTAHGYGNEESVGKAIRDSGIPRDQIFVTSKLPAGAKTAEAAQQAFAESMARLDLGYIDMYLIHAPWPWEEFGADYRVQNRTVWAQMESFYTSKKVRAIGISNFNVRDQEDLYAHCKIKPMALQLQYYIGFTEDDNVQCAKENGLLVEAFSPLATGFLLNNDAVKTVAAHYGTGVAQVAIRYVLQKGLLPLPKATSPAHIKANTELDFTLSAEDMKTLDSLKDTAPGEDNNRY
ncbi:MULTISPECIES: aldo/keto reductase [unclassified Lacticaseibacillus]|uniref:aldo/keto reductase n=1 Tax=unclassified Lacticaseibacillus TaxID=2759744 RepID=UPI0019435508|nr:MULTISPECIES: aldo/keto reductase [unclassified Lacticaseibacillus]